MSAEVERNLLNHYQLTSLYPSEWPKRDGDSDDSETEQPARKDVSRRSSSKASRRMSRFSGLDSKTNYKSRLSGSKDTGSGSGNIVQKDEPDPLGISPSVVSSLRARGLEVEDNLKFRNRFMLSSTTFSPSLFLSNVHQTASTDELLQGLDFLSKSIEKKSASLKVLVESNFERFVKAKATIDNVYTEMRTQGAQPQTLAPTRAPHSRVSSRGTGHFRSASNPFSPQGQKHGEDQKKTALTKESEYGVMGIKAPLIELAVKAEEVWGPALGGRDRGDDLKSTLNFVERNRDLFRLAGNIQASVRRQEYDLLVEDYQKAKQASQAARDLLERADNDPSSLGEAQLFKVLATAKMWYDVEAQIAAFRKSALKQLASVEAPTDNLPQHERRESHTELISVLLQLGTQENPIWLWLSSWHGRLREKITKSFERARLDLEILRRKLAVRGEPSPHQIKAYFQAASSGGVDAQRNRLDSPQVIQFWELVERTFENLLSPKTGVLGDIADYWENVRSFMDGTAQKDLPNSVWTTEESRQHLYMSGEHMRELQNSTNELIRLLREAVFTLFLESPIEDISELFSPAPLSPDSNSPPPTPSDRLRTMGIDPENVPPLTPKIGEVWEKYAFWPPHSNALSGALYLSRILILIGSAASEATAISVVKEDPRGVESLRNMVGSVRERCVQAVCAAWNSDAENIKLLEDWSKNSDRKDLTNMPMRFMAFEESVLADTQKILYLSEAMTRSNGGDVVVPPPTKLLQMVRSQFVTSLYKALSGTVENAEKSRQEEQINGSDSESLVVPQNSDIKAQESSSQAIHLGRNVRMLLTLSNLKHLQRDIIPALINHFETSFSVQLTEESNTIRDVLGQIETRLFQSYVGPTVKHLISLIANGISDPSWTPKVQRPTNARPYVYDILLQLVLVHTEVSTSATTLTNAVLSHHLEQISLALLDAFKRRPTYTLSALMQATLDVELTAQTLSNYTTERASELQSQIYLILDERTDHEARSRLQSELPEMRATLKKLREGTRGQFGCFKRERRGERGRDRGERPGTAGSR
ncbi:hypothetical protein K461DRAFT_321976 [Myriangium duriaei CBS 260.36]|uniref:Exocyst complex component SEC5 n=1 Tax=Myriangium duriaei CBS 260.36 TaxID=1168546 RepID=A0A9P4J3N6_9PEZI|nr:hypothetical protein K461DRAFT_321976 [Myriangium duriaei CBS 260.36]